MSEPDLDKLAPEGYIYLCTACGKTSPTQSGWHNKQYVAQRGWDVSCMLNCQLVSFVKPQNQVTITDGGAMEIQKK